MTTACQGYDTVSYNKRTRLIVPFPVLQKQQSMYTATKDMSCINEKKKKKKVGVGAMFNPNASVQSIIRVRHGAV